jgi:hypothetical protein
MEQIIDQFNKLESFGTKLVVLKALAGQLGARIQFQNQGAKPSKVKKAPKPKEQSQTVPAVQATEQSKTVRPSVQQAKAPQNLNPAVIALQKELEEVKFRIRACNAAPAPVPSDLLEKRSELLKRLKELKIQFFRIVAPEKDEEGPEGPAPKASAP